MSPSKSPTPASEASRSAVDAAMDDLLIQLFPEYEIEGRLGGGGGGTVYRAEHRRLHRRVAIKVLSGALTRSVAAVARFEREIEAIGQLDDPGIVRAFDGGQREGVWFLAMELVEGVDFGTLSRALGPLPPADACELVRQAALALHHAHERKLIHRDVKPDNFLFARTPVLDLSKRAYRDQSSSSIPIPLLYLIDFGMAKRITPSPLKVKEVEEVNEEEGLREHGVQLIGSARYASVFAHCGEPLGRRDDLISMMYSLIYVALGGALPWMNYTERDIYYIKDNMTPSEICAGLSPRHATQWAAVLERLHIMHACDVPDYAMIESLL